MSTVTKKFQLGAAAVAVIAAAGLVPAVAHADDTSTDTTQVGAAAGRAPRGAANRPSTPGGTTPSTDSSSAPASPDRSANATASATGSNPLLQNQFWWFGTPNPTPPPSTTITTTTPLADIPGWARPAYGWFTDTNAQTCVLGLSNTTNGSAGPYGTSTTSFSSQGC